jgi:hypothetical protein
MLGFFFSNNLKTLKLLQNSPICPPSSARFTIKYLIAHHHTVHFKNFSFRPRTVNKTTWASFVPRTIPKTGPRHSRATRRKIPTTTYLFQNLLLPIPTIKAPVLLYSPPTTTRLHKPHRMRQTKHVVPVLTPVPIKRCCHFDDPMSNPTFCRAFPKKCTLATR